MTSITAKLREKTMDILLVRFSIRRSLTFLQMFTLQVNLSSKWG